MFDINQLRDTAPFGFNLFEGTVYYSGEKPNDSRLMAVLVEDRIEAMRKYREESRDTSFAVIVKYGGKKDTNYIIYRANENNMENIYIILRKIYEGWYKWDNLLGLDDILSDESKKFSFDSADFEFFRNAMLNIQALNLIRSKNKKAVGESLAISYIDFLAENYENEILQNRGMSRKRPRNLYRAVMKYKN